ncbi:MAG: exopolysaccharide biosynthesis polyprenyl glycosylphosphotransferase [Microthrixaceae bacterium]|nr:exopolysaccharide biosynthesis polyprenyl glycosylphosphotransferase [Microthrixaceae bacterium]
MGHGECGAKEAMTVDAREEHAPVLERRSGSSGYSGPERRSTTTAGIAAARGTSRGPSRSTEHYVAMAVDALLVMASLALGITVWALGHQPVPTRRISELVWFSLASLPVWILVFRWQRLYAERDDSRFIADVLRVVNGVGLGALAFILLAWPINLELPRTAVVVAVVVLAPVLLVERQLIRTVVRRRRRRGVGLRPVAILGANAEAISLAETLVDPVLGRNVVGFISTRENVPEVLSGLPVHVTTNPAATAASLDVECVVIAATSLDSTAPTGLLRSFLDRHIAVEMTSAFTGVANDRIHVHTLGPYPLMAIDRGYRGGWRATAKRAFDLVVSVSLLVLLAPLLAVSVIAVKLDTEGPVFYSQARLGRRARPFQLHKIRTMVVGADSMKDDLRESNESDGPLFKMSEDPRVTRVGRVLRKFSIDEIPQLWNVIKGEMSLVGPRPALANEAEAWSDELRHRLRVRPGLTGMWQVNGRSDTSFSEYERLDLFYIDNWSILTDLGILARTVPAVLSRKGAA